MRNRKIYSKTLFIVFLFFTSFIQAQVRTTEKTTIPFILSPNGHILIEAKVNGLTGNFVFDTGAGMNLLTKKFADTITDLEETNHFHTGHRATGEEIQSDLWIANELKIGDYKVLNEYCAVYPIDFPFEGLISLTPFLDAPVTIDFDKKEITIETEESIKTRKKDAKYVLPIEVSNDRNIDIGMSTTINLNDKLSLHVKLDSGAGFDVYRFNSRYMNHLDIDSTTVKSEFKPSYFKPEEGNTFYYTELANLSDENKNKTVENLKATFIDGLIYEGIMGINWLGNILTLDIKNSQIIVGKHQN